MPKAKQFDEAGVIMKARALFSEKGYNGTSMEDLVKATGLNRSSIYDTFGDKHRLYLRTLEDYQKTNFSATEVALQKITTPKKKIQWLFSNTVKEILQDPQRKGCFMVNATTELANQDKKVSKMACDSMAMMEDRFYGWIKCGQDSGEISKRHSARAMSRYLYSSISGLQILGQTISDKHVLDDVVKVTLGVLDDKV